MPPTEMLAEYFFVCVEREGMLSDLESFFSKLWEGECCPFLGTLEFEAVEKRQMLPVFQILSFEAVDKGGMLSVFQILFSGRPLGGGNAVRFLFF